MATFAKLRARDSYKLLKFIETEYTNLGKSDREFAEIATKALGVKVTNAAVSHRRNELGIKSYLDTLKEKHAAEATEREQQRLEKDRLRKQKERALPTKAAKNDAVIQRLDTIISKLDSLVSIWSVKE